MDIAVRICLAHFGNKTAVLINNHWNIWRCIRERNCGTGYQVDPVTQTCVGKERNLEKIFIFIYWLVSKMWTNVNRIFMNVGKWLSHILNEETTTFLFRPGYICHNVPGTYKYLSTISKTRLLDSHFLQMYTAKLYLWREIQCFLWSLREDAMSSRL